MYDPPWIAVLLLGVACAVLVMLPFKREKLPRWWLATLAAGALLTAVNWQPATWIGGMVMFGLSVHLLVTQPPRRPRHRDPGAHRRDDGA